jgi:hypothetical protein
VGCFGVGVGEMGEWMELSMRSFSLFRYFLAIQIPLAVYTLTVVWIFTAET